MDSAKTNTNPQPLTDRTPREAIIRDLYALAAFYVANPDHPLPVSICAHHVAPAEEVEAIAQRFGGKVYRKFPQTDHELPGTSVRVILYTTVPREDRPL